MTHEYTVATGGLVLGATAGQPATALAWAEDTVLAVGTDAEVRAISRGDSTFVDLVGLAVSAGRDAAAATHLLRAAVARGSGAGIERLLAGIEPGAPADLLIWSRDPRTLAAEEAADLRVVGFVRAGHLTWTDGPPRS